MNDGLSYRVWMRISGWIIIDPSRPPRVIIIIIMPINGVGGRGGGRGETLVSTKGTALQCIIIG